MRQPYKTLRRPFCCARSRGDTNRSEHHTAFNETKKWQRNLDFHLNFHQATSANWKHGPQAGGEHLRTGCIIHETHGNERSKAKLKVGFTRFLHGWFEIIVQDLSNFGCVWKYGTESDPGVRGIDSIASVKPHLFCANARDESFTCDCFQVLYCGRRRIDLCPKGWVSPQLWLYRRWSPFFYTLGMTGTGVCKAETNLKPISKSTHCVCEFDDSSHCSCLRKSYK